MAGSSARCASGSRDAGARARRGSGGRSRTPRARRSRCSATGSHVDGLALGAGCGPWPGRPRRRARSRCSRRARPAPCRRGPRARGCSPRARCGTTPGAPSPSAGSNTLVTDRGVRADHRAAVALHAQVGLPDRDLERDGPLLVAARPGRPGPVGRERAHGQLGRRGPRGGGGSTRCTKSGASSGTVGARRRRWSAVAGTAISCSRPSAASIASTLRRTISGPRSPQSRAPSP